MNQAVSSMPHILQELDEGTVGIYDGSDALIGFARHKLQASSSTVMDKYYIYKGSLGSDKWLLKGSPSGGGFLTFKFTGTNDPSTTASLDDFRTRAKELLGGGTFTYRKYTETYIANSW